MLTLAVPGAADCVVKREKLEPGHSENIPRLVQVQHFGNCFPPGRRKVFSPLIPYLLNLTILIGRGKYGLNSYG